MVKVNPTILRWARETAGINIDDACRKLGINETQELTARERLLVLEEGTVEPSRPMLVKMAKQYHRPLITFYMEEPPIKGERGQDFRSLPDSFSQEDIALVDAIVRNVIVRQSIVRAALEDEEEVESISFVGSSRITDGVSRLVDSINQVIKFDLGKFYKQSSPNEAFALLRTHIESVGVFVLLIGDLGSHHTDVDIKAFRGFALADRYAPFIIINDNDSKAAWSFTLIHELTHIFLGQTGISGTSDDFEVEKFCNSVAGKFLLPDDELQRLKINHDLDKGELLKQISAFADDRNLSSSMVAYNLYLNGEISKDSWFELNNIYRDLWKKHKSDKRIQRNEEEGGPDYYVVRRHRLGNNITSFAQQMLAGGTITTTEAGKVLGLKPQNVQKLFELQSYQ
jgi:Zn-dependent peptidase ImmA (M78 family)